MPWDHPFPPRPPSGKCLRAPSLRCAPSSLHHLPFFPPAQALCPGSLALQASHFKRVGVPGAFASQESLWVPRSSPHAEGLASQGGSWSVSSLSGAGAKSSPSPPRAADPLMAPWADSLTSWSILMIEKLSPLSASVWVHLKRFPSSAWTGKNHLFPLPLLLCGAGRQNESSGSFLTGCLSVAWRAYAPCVPQSLCVETLTPPCDCI